MGGNYDFHAFSTAAQAFCSRHWDVIFPDWQAGKYPNADLERLKTECVKSVWISVALHEGFSFPLDFAHLISAPNTVNSQVVHWTIGALLYRTRMYDPINAMNQCSTVSYLYPFPPISPKNSIFSL